MYIATATSHICAKNSSSTLLDIIATCGYTLQVQCSCFMMYVFHLTAAFTMEGRRTILQKQEYIPSILFREENNVKHYISLKKSNSEDSHKLTITKVSSTLQLLSPNSLQLATHSSHSHYFSLSVFQDRNLATTFLVKSMDTNGKYFSLQYKDKKTETMLCLQGAFPTDNGQIVYQKVHPKVGNCYTRMERDTHIIPLLASIRPKKNPKCL